MNPRYSLKVIKQGQTHKVQTVSPGAGMQGQAMVVQAIDGARMQLADIVTLSAPEKLQMKRVGKDLQIALPGGDVDAPDIVVKDYYAVKDVSLQGQAISGEWQVYNTVSLPDTAPQTATPESKAAQGQNWSSGFSDPIGAQSVGLADASVVSAAQAAATAAATGTAATGMSMGTMIAVGAGGLALAGGGGGGGSAAPVSDPTSKDLETLKAYANATNGVGVTAPTLTTYKDAGVKALANLSQSPASADIDSAVVTGNMGSTWLQALNSALDKQTGDASLTVAKLQLMVDSYYRILSEADGIVNTTTNVDVYPSGTTNAASDDPLSGDYTNIGVTVGNAKSVDLLNDYVGAAVKASVDTVDEINVLARASYNVMLLAGMGPGSGTMPTAYSTTDSHAEWIAGLNKLLGLDTTTGVNTNNVAAVKAAIAATATLTSINGGQGVANDGLEVDTVQEIKDLIKSAIALQTLVDYANATNGVGVTAPTLTTYKDAGVKALANLSQSPASADIDSAVVTGNMGSTWLQALNSALDKQTGDASLTVAKLQLMVDSYYRILSEADGIVNTTTNVDVYPSGTTNAASDDPLSGDYTNIGATVGSTLKAFDLLNDFVGLSQKSAVDTVDEINTVSRAAENVMLKAKGLTATALGGPAIYASNSEWIVGLSALGITGVDATNIDAIKSAIDNSTDNLVGDGTALDTVAKVQQFVSLARVQAFTNDTGLLTGTPAKTASTPTLGDWTALGVKARGSLSDASATLDLTSSNTNLTAINSALDRWDGAGASLDTTAHAKSTMQNIVDSYARVFAEADGNRGVNTDVYPGVADAGAGFSNAGKNDPAKSDYENLLGGSTALATLVSTADAKWIDLLNDFLGGVTTSNVNTVSQIEDMIKASVSVMNQAVGSGWSYSTDSEWVTALTSLGVSGLSGMSTTNLATVKSNISAITNSSDIDTWSELQGIVSLIRVNDYATSSNNTNPNFTDYQSFFSYGVSGKTDITNNTTYVNALNDAVNYKSANSFTLAEIKALVDGYSAILAEANGVTSDQQTYDPVVADYKAVGIGDGLGASNVTTMLNDTANGGSTDLVALLTDVIAGKYQGDVDTVNELNTLAKIITKIYELEQVTQVTNGGTTGTTSNYYTNIYNGALQVSELKALGLDTTNLENYSYSTNVLNKRLYDVYDHIVAIDHTSATSRQTLDTLAELQALINNTSTITA